jgi:photosynthetic reaction center cytochrome c subunit
MIGKKNATVLALTALAAGLAIAGAGARAQSVQSQAKAVDATPKMTQDAFKNIQVLKDVPADQLIPAMQFISTSLGVDCDHCHVEKGFEKDDKDEKKTARKMMLMMFAINKDNFKGHREVTCYSCHRGSAEPVGTPIISDEELKAESAVEEKAEAAQPVLPAADQLLDKYLQALGGREALGKISSRIEKGTLTSSDGDHAAIEVSAKAPDKRFSAMHLPKGGESITAFDGHMGWLGNPQRPPRAMSPAENENARLDAEIQFGTDLKTLFTGFRVRTKEKVAGHDTYVVNGFNEGKPPVKFYFDVESGLLLRFVRYTETPLGRNPVQVDFADYRKAGGVKVPYRWTLARPSGRFTIQVDELRQNVPVDDAKFAMPAAAPAAESK